MSSEIVCPSCGARGTIVYNEATGEYVCTVCGTVLEDHIIDYGKEWRTFSPEDSKKRSRTGAPLTSKVHDHGLTTTIDMGYLRRIRNPRMRARYERMSRLHSRSRVRKKDRKLVTLLTKLNDYAAKLKLSSVVVEEASRILRKAVEKRVVRGKDLEPYVATAIYIACRIHRVPVTDREITSTMGISGQDLWHKLSVFRKKVVPGVKYLPPRPEDYAARIASKLDLSPRVSLAAIRLLLLSEKYGVSTGKNPVGMAAAAVYLASVVFDEKRTQKEVADAIGLTEVTVRNRYRDLVDNFYIEVEV